jgi:two-component system, chemotaxis family, protein-glutamate methylesterase/glutaminase
MRRSTSSFPVVLIVASRGGRDAVARVFKSLPVDFRAAVVLVQHRAELPGRAWADMLRSLTPLPVKEIERGDALKPGVVYLAPATRHVSIEAGGLFKLADGARICGVLSSANPLFESAGRTLGRRAVAVVLTGYGRDATDGVRAVKAGGGVVIAQDRESSRDFGMPGSAIATGAVDYVRPLEEIGPLVRELVEHRQEKVGSFSASVTRFRQ